MKILKGGFKGNIMVYPYTIYEIDEGDASFEFSDGTLDYLLSLDWDGGVMDIEFGVVDCNLFDTTNTHNHYKILHTIGHIVKSLTIDQDIGLEYITFKSSDSRDGDDDSNSEDIRNRFFIRHIMREYPNAEISTGKNDSMIIKLN